MPDLIEISKVVRFETFELNLKTGELRKGGVKIRLQEQSYQILAALHERPAKPAFRLGSVSSKDRKHRRNQGVPERPLKISGEKDCIIAGYFRIELDSLSGRC